MSKLFLFFFLFFFLVTLLSCNDLEIKKINIDFPSFGKSGKITSINHKKKSSTIIINSGDEIKISPNIKIFSKNFDVKIGDDLILYENRTIGSLTKALHFYRNNKKYFSIISGDTFFRVTTSKTKKFINREEYSLKIGKILNEDSREPWVPASLLLIKDNKTIEVYPSQKVSLDDGWEMILVTVLVDNPNFKREDHITRETPPLRYDYILYQNIK